MKAAKKVCGESILLLKSETELMKGYDVILLSVDETPLLKCCEVVLLKGETSLLKYHEGTLLKGCEIVVLECDKVDLIEVAVKLDR